MSLFAVNSIEIDLNLFQMKQKKQIYI